MKSFTESGGPAFPSTVDRSDGSSVAYAGMTLRDYFAAKVMNGLAGQLLKWNAEVTKTGETLTERAKVMIPDVANVAYQIADAMLAERSK